MRAARAGRLRRMLWRGPGRVLFRRTGHSWYGPRRWILTAFGARLGRRCRLRRSVDVDAPWNLTVETLAMLGDGVVLRARAPIRIGARAVISQYAMLSTERRDPDRPGCPVHAAPIAVGQDCWIATDTLILPGATVGDGAVIGARSMVEGRIPAWTVAAGEPAVPLRTRVMDNAARAHA